MTQDIDFIISTDKENIEKILNVLEKLNYIPRLPINPILLTDENIRKEWIKEKNLKAFTFNHKTEMFKTIDMLLVHNLNFEQAFLKRVEIDIGDFKIKVVAVDDLISMKEYAGRAKDFEDIEALQYIYMNKGEN
ncbi:MAG: hypothetical protein KBA47_00270 [Caldisericia bacterium]|nr:hypothetical protein [Caldisericia bacterium]